MANVKFVFLGTERSKTNDTELECFANNSDEIFITIESDGNYPQSICLDRSTAIRFAKTLRTEINKIRKES